MESYEGYVRLKIKVGKRCNIVWNLPSVVVDSDTKTSKNTKNKTDKNKRKQNDLSNIHGNLTDCSGFLWCCK